MRWLLPILVPLAAGLVPAPVQAADPLEGRRLAEQWCANCHRIAPGGPGPASDAVPSFPALARQPGRTEEAIATFLRLPHPPMPDHGLTLQQARDVAAFLLSQRGP